MMNFPLFIAGRYLVSRQKKHFIHLITFLAVGSVAFSTAALIIVLSVFNGLEDLLRSLNTAFDPELKIEPASGKTFEVSEEWLQRISAVPGVAIVTEVIEDYAYARYRDANQVVTLKGVSDNFLLHNRMDDKIVAGRLVLREGDVNYALIGRGIQYQLSASTDDPQYLLQLFYVNTDAGSATTDFSRLYTRRSVQIGGVFSIVQQLDENYIIVPLEVARELMNMGNRRTALEIKLKDDARLADVQRQLRQLLGEAFVVLNQDEQHRDLYRLLKVEKLFTFLSLSVLIAVGSVNIFFILTMLALEKKRDISILSALGATPAHIRAVFLYEGLLIAGVGTIAGLLGGVILVLLQHHYGLISMGMETSVTEGYPVKIVLFDFVAVTAVVTILTILLSWKPATQAARLVFVRNL
jgi:lipoprotein-releasing system permease protein